MGSTFGRGLNKDSSADMSAPKGQVKGYARYVTRAQWEACPEEPVGLLPLTTPVDSVVATWTDTPPCTTAEECMASVRQVQRQHVHDMGMPDIRYHFLVGGDGSIYEGRGWRWQGPDYPPTTEDAEILSGKSIEVAFIDKFIGQPTEQQLQIFSSVVTYGQDDGHLKDKFKFYFGKTGSPEYFSTYDPVTDLQNMADAEPDQQYLPT